MPSPLSSMVALDKPSTSRHPHRSWRRRCPDPLRPLGFGQPFLQSGTVRRAVLPVIRLSQRRWPCACSITRRALRLARRREALVDVVQGVRWLTSASSSAEVPTRAAASGRHALLGRFTGPCGTTGRAAGRVALDDADGLVAELFMEAAREEVVGAELDERAAQSAGLVLRRRRERLRPRPRSELWTHMACNSQHPP